MPCRPYSYDTLRCHRKHAESDPLLGQPIKPRKLGRRAAEDATETAQRKLSPGLEPKTVVNTHRMLHRAWEDFTVWGWAKRNIVSDAHPPRVPRKGRKVWTVAQLQRFLQYARSDRFFALWVLEATSGMRRCELAGARLDLLDLDAGTLAIEVTRVVVDGRVVESDGKTENAQHVLALDPFTLAVLKAHVEQLAGSGASSARTTRIMACCSAGRTAGRRILTRSRGDSRSSPRRPDCQRSTCTTSGTATPPQAAMPRSTGRR
jgi:integrase